MKKHTIITVPIDELSPNEWNPNKMSDIKLNALVETVKRNGQTHPIQVVKDKKGYRIVGGEHRWKAMKLLKYKEVEVIVREYEDEIDEKLGGVEDNLRGQTIPIKEALIVAAATKKYPLSALEKRLGESQGELRDKMLLAGEENALKKMQENIEREHTVEITFILDADAKKNAENFIKELSRVTAKLGATIQNSSVKLSTSKETVAVVIFQVSDLQKNVVEQAITSIMKSEEVGRGRALELCAAEYLSGN